MPRNQTDEILARWKRVTERVSLPDDAPHTARVSNQLPMGAFIGAVAVIAIVLTTRAMGPLGPTANAGASAEPTADNGGISTIEPTAARSVPRDEPTAPPPAATSCSSKQLALGKTTSAHGFGALGTTLIFVTQKFHNVGSRCSIDMPTEVGVAGEGAAFEEVAIQNGSTASSFVVGDDANGSIVIGAWWANERQPADSSMHCERPVSGVTKVRLDVGSGSIDIDLGVTLLEVCTAPASLSLAVE